MSEPAPAASPASGITVLIVGAGITGLGAAYHLRTHNIPYVILEKDADLGGVWHTHRWHGVRCDSEIIKYSFSFKPFLSLQAVQSGAAIHRYLRATAAEFGIEEHIRFNTAVTRAVFDLEAKQWIVHTTQGTFTSQFLLNGNGYFAEPYVPAFPGSDRFQGEIVHTAHLDGARTFRDKDVVVVGSGATAICCAPELARESRSLVLLQRSPSYIYEISNRTGLGTRLSQRLYSLGITGPMKLLRHWIQCKDDVVFVGFRRFPRFARWFFKRHWLPTVGDEAFRAHFRPRYNPWEQRITVAIGLKEKLRTKEIVVRTGEIDRFTDTSIVLTGGDEITCDVCVLATGFDLNLLKFDVYVGDEKIGVAGRDFYKRMMLGGVPNYFHPVGAWHTAWTQSSETVARFAVKIMAYMKRNGFRSVSVDRRDVEFTPPLTANYIKRSLARMPKFYGTYDLPSLDNLVSYRFNPRSFRFS